MPVLTLNGVRYKTRTGMPAGPVSHPELLQLIERGEVDEETPVFNAALGNWVPLRTQPALADALLKTAAPESKKVSVDEELLVKFAAAGYNEADKISEFFQQGGRVVVYRYAISIIVLSLMRSSGYCLVRAGESRAAHSLRYCLYSLLFGWWGLPGGPVFVVQSLLVNLTGGEDVTAAFLQNDDSLEILDAERRRIRNLWVVTLGLAVILPLAVLIAFALMNDSVPR